MNRSSHRSGCHAGFTRRELLVIILTVVVLAGLLAGAARNFVIKARRIHCISNLKQLGVGTRLWGGNEWFARREGTNAAPTVIPSHAFLMFQGLTNWISEPGFFICPSDTRRAAASFANLSDTNLSYFAGLETDEMNPQCLLMGDRNFTVNGVPAGPGLLTLTGRDRLGWTDALHRRCGNVGLADGSAQQLSSNRLATILNRGVLWTNRLLIP